MLKKQTNAARKYFTLVEMLVVIAILLILLSLGFAGMNKMFEKSDIATARADILTLHNAFEAYEEEYGASIFEDTLIALKSGSRHIYDAKLNTVMLDHIGFNWRGKNLRVDDDGYVLDPWETPYYYDRDSHGFAFMIFSRGPNGNVAFDQWKDNSTNTHFFTQDNNAEVLLEEDEKIVITNMPGLSKEDIIWFGDADYTW